ncbi:hypothetical protein ACE5M2_18350 [Clostridioides difficile]
MEIGENKIAMKYVEYVVYYSNPREFELYIEKFDNLKAAKDCKEKIEKEYKDIDVTKRTIYEEFITDKI